MNEGNDKQSSESFAKPTLLMRLAAGLWFALAFGVLELSYFAYLLGPSWNLKIILSSTYGLYRIIAPASVAGICGSLLGAAILAGSRPKQLLFAASQGMAIGILCTVSHIGFWALEETLASPQPNLKEFLWSVLFIIMFWAWFAGVLGPVYGGVVGTLLNFTARIFQRRV